MQYSPKLKKAMAEIEAVLKAHDIGGVVIIHTPGHSEFLNHLSPSYSCITTEGDKVRFRSKLADYNGDVQAWKRKTTDSLNLLQCLTNVGAHIMLPLIDFTDKLENDLNADTSGGSFTSHVDQNN